tara:strand:- start:10963 stop:12132 length:1170 start_codon:yes stop_codon:yes gene_type:complete
MTKIRLIRNDGEVLVLDATDYSLNITRSVPVMPVPVLGERYAIDLNMVTADFKLNVILADDDCAALANAPNAASASIDFSALANADGGTRQAYMTSGTVSVNDLHNNFFEIESTYTGENTVRPPVRIKFNKNSASHSSSNTPSTVLVGIQGITTDDALAAAVKTACEAASFTQQLTTAGGTSFSSAFTITVSNGELTNNARLTFTQTEAGFGGNNATPVFNKGFTSVIPLFDEFAGGTNKSCRSAGDKLQDLIAYVGNASLLGVSGSALGGRADPDDTNSLIEQDVSLSEKQTADYIVGMQVPYNSMITSTSPNDDYTERNIIMITGRSDANQQDSTANNLDVGVVFDPTNKYTGIAGTVVAMSMNYVAGENVYEGSLTFMPVDFIVGS